MTDLETQSENLSDMELYEAQKARFKVLQDTLDKNRNKSDTTEHKRDYGNKYMENKTTVSIDKTVFKDLIDIQTKKGFKTKGELMRYFVDVEKVFSPKTEIVFKCKDCGEIVDIPPNINVDKFRHRDLCKDNQCKGSFTTDFKIKTSGTNDNKDDKSDTNDNKDDKSDVTDIKVRESDANDKKDEEDKEFERIMIERNKPFNLEEFKKTHKPIG